MGAPSKPPSCAQPTADAATAAILSASLHGARDLSGPQDRVPASPRCPAGHAAPTAETLESLVRAMARRLARECFMSAEQAAAGTESGDGASL